MPEQTVAKADAGDYHFELKKGKDGKYKCVRSDVSDPTGSTEEVRDLQEIPPQVFSIFNRLMY